MNGYLRRFLILASAIATLSTASSADAHFLWLKTIEVDGAPQAFLFFGENPADEAYHMPEKMAGAKIWRRTADGPREELPSEKLETDDRIGIVAKLPSDAACVLETSQPYGVYEDWLLTYFAKHIHADSNDRLAATGPSKELALDIVPRADGDQLGLTVLSGGEPLADAEVSVTVGDGDTIETKTDDKGVATVTPEGEGLVTVLASYRDKTKSGSVGDKEYKVAANFVTLTFPWQQAKPAGAPTDEGDEPTDADSASNSRFPPLPEAVASFGAVVDDGWLYVYGGHTGTEHDHSAANLSKHFARVKLDGAGEWENLPMPAPLQGLPLVAHGNKVYRVGGLDARNPTIDEEEDLHSTDEFAVFDPTTGEWASLAPLSAGRSSHNAVVIDNKLYVVGGWKLKGSSKGEWQPDALVYDFTNPDAGWQKTAEPPFKRRAIAAAHVNGKVVVLGGMNEDAKVSQDVYIYDPVSDDWSEGPELPGAGMAGFGVSAWNLDGKLYVSGFRGVVYRLNDAGSEWEEAARLTTPRFFHQLVPAGDGGLLAVGGAARTGHLADIEWVDVSGAAEAGRQGGKETRRADRQETEPIREKSRASAATGHRDEVVVGVAGERFALTASTCPGDIWPGFRGLGNSVTAARDLPVAWSDEQGIAWVAQLPGYGQSSPVVHSGKVFVTTMLGDNKETPTVICYRLATGEKLWQREFTSSQPVKASNFTTRSSPTPVADAAGVFVFFESGELIALDHVGNTRWERSLVDEYGKFESEFGIGSSLAQTEGAIFVLVNQSAPSYLMAVDKLTGKNTWKADYPGRVAWSSPIVHRYHNRDLVVVSAAGIVEAYDATCGSRLWQLDRFAENNIPSPTAADDYVFIGSANVDSNVALLLTEGGSVGASTHTTLASSANVGESTRPTTPKIVWRSEAASCNFSSPLYYEGFVYMVNRSGVAFCLDALTGRTVWKHRLPDTCWASPLAARGRIYFFTKGGATVVARAGGEWDELAENQLAIDPNSRIYGIAAIDDALVIRTGTQLFCLGIPSGV